MNCPFGEAGGKGEFSRYFTHVLPAGPVRGETAEEIIANVDEDGFAVIGTPEDAIAKIQSLVDESGGFGTFLGSIPLATELMEYGRIAQGIPEAKGVRCLLRQCHRLLALRQKAGRQTQLRDVEPLAGGVISFDLVIESHARIE